MNQDPIVSLIILYLTQPLSDFYLPKLIMGAHDPNLEPFNSSRIDLGTQNVMGMPMHLALENLEIEGLSHIEIAKEADQHPRIEVQDSEVTFYAIRPNTEAPPPNVPMKLDIFSDFIISIPGRGALPAGQIQITVAHTTVKGVFDATSTDGSADSVKIGFKSLKIIAAANNSNMHVNIKLQSAFVKMINAVLNQPATLQKILDGLNEKLKDHAVLEAISKEATAAARSALKESLLAG